MKKSKVFIYEQLFNVGRESKKTGENISLLVWARSVDEATHRVVDAIGGPYGEYHWTGSGPEYENNEVVTRERESA